MGNQHLHAPVSVGRAEVNSVQCFQCGFGHADRTGVAFGQAVIALVAPLPDAVIGNAVGPGHVVHQVLDEGGFVAVMDDSQTAGAQLGQLQQKQ